jgi:hypothetical protein
MIVFFINAENLAQCLPNASTISDGNENLKKYYFGLFRAPQNMRCMELQKLYSLG